MGRFSGESGPVQILQAIISWNAEEGEFQIYNFADNPDKKSQPMSDRFKFITLETGTFRVGGNYEPEIGGFRSNIMLENKYEYAYVRKGDKVVMKGQWKEIKDDVYDKKGHWVKCIIAWLPIKEEGIMVEIRLKTVAAKQWANFCAKKLDEHPSYADGYLVTYEGPVDIETRNGTFKYPTFSGIATDDERIKGEGWFDLCRNKYEQVTKWIEDSHGAAPRAIENLEVEPSGGNPEHNEGDSEPFGEKKLGADMDDLPF